MGSDSPCDRSPNADALLQAYLLGVVEFEAALALQRRLVFEVSCQRSIAAIVLCEHPPLVTVGRHGSGRQSIGDATELRARGWRVRWVNRGGGYLLHQPGQIAIYPVLALDNARFSVRSYLDRLRQVLIDVLDEFNIRARPRSGQAGLWVGDRLIADVGVAVRNWVTYFGAVLNVNPDLTAFGQKRAGLRMTSLERERHGPLPPSRIRERLLEHFAARFAFAQTAVFFDHPSMGKVRRHAVAASS